MQLDIGNIVSVLLGGLLVFVTQWVVSRQNWKKEELREKDRIRLREYQRIKYANNLDYRVYVREYQRNKRSEQLFNEYVSDIIRSIWVI